IFIERRVWERAFVEAMQKRIGERMAPLALQSWSNVYRAVRWYKLRLLSKCLDRWRVMARQALLSTKAEMDGIMYFELRSKVAAVRAWHL
ncbi:MAG: hypothetical protein CMI56_00185, partial [Parcubacteria group bacterium]|nr:hypothetical protein [Parcubacteria group bacterium]